jgi:hypothetical protein
MLEFLVGRAGTTTPAAMGFWGVAFLLVYGTGLLAGSFSPAVGHYGDTLILTSLGLACFANFTRHRTLHCGLSGPISVLGALVAATVEAGVWDLDLRLMWASCWLRLPARCSSNGGRQASNRALRTLMDARNATSVG